MTEVLLSSEKLVKECACVNDNVASEYILSSLTEAQNITLKGILGPNLLNRIKVLIQDSALDTEPMYKELVDQCQYFLAYTTLAALTYKTTYKISNFGVTRTNDENVSVPSFDEVAKIRDYYQSKADFYCIELQTFLWQNRSSFPELNRNRCERIKSNIYSAASCGIWLGGIRGKR